VEGICLPETEEEDTEENAQNADADGLSLLEDLDNAVHEGSDPEKPLQECHQHERANDGNVNNLLPLVLVLTVSDDEFTHMFGLPWISDVRDAAVVGGAGENAHEFGRRHGGLLSIDIRCCR
jgi:hypothetical protein